MKASAWRVGRSSATVQSSRTRTRNPEESLPWFPGWSDLAEIVELELVPGRHFTVTREPHVRALAERVRRGPRPPGPS